MKTVVLVDGGVVREIWGDVPDLEVEVIDMDVLRAQGLTEGEREARLQDAIKDLEVTWR